MPGTFDYKTQAIQALAPTKVRWRKPFSAVERGRPGMRLLQKTANAIGPLRAYNSSTIGIVNAASNGSIIVGVGGVVATGAANATGVSSADGITWTSRALNTASQNWYSVAWTGTAFVAGGVGGSSSIPSYSADGVTWTAGATIALSGLGHMVALKGKVYAFGQSYANYYESSNNSVSWSTAKTLPVATPNSTNILRHIVSNSNYMFMGVIGANGVATVYRTSDGTNWTASNSLQAASNSAAAAPIIAANDGTLIAVINDGTSSVVFISKDDGATFGGGAALRPVSTFQAVSQAGGMANVFGGSNGMQAPMSVGAGRYYAEFGRFIFSAIVSTQYYNGTSMVTSRLHCLLHTVDGTDWVLEEPVSAYNAYVGFPPLLPVGSDYLFLSTDSVAGFSTAKLNRNFEELVCDY